jgi:uncharacterized protein YdaU (DUF1376 family)
MSAKADLWMPLFIGDYLRDTRRLTTEQHGAYLLLIMEYWVGGPLPDDDAVLANIAGLSSDAWGIHRAMLERFFTISGGHWTHKRIDAERIRAIDNQSKRAERAAKAANARWNAQGNASGNAPSIRQALLGQCPSPSPSPSPSESENNEESSGGRGRRLPANFKMPPDWLAWASENSELTQADIGREAASFVDHFHSTPGGRGRKSDWLATWRNWVRRARPGPRSFSMAEGKPSGWRS